MVSAVLDALATLPGPLLLAVFCGSAFLETAVLARSVADDVGRIGRAAGWA